MAYKDDNQQAVNQDGGQDNDYTFAFEANEQDLTPDVPKEGQGDKTQDPAYSSYEAAKRATEAAQRDPMLRATILQQLGYSPQQQVQQPAQQQQIATPYDAQLTQAEARKKELDAAMATRELQPGEVQEYYRLDSVLATLPAIRDNYLHTERLNQQNLASQAPGLVQSYVTNFPVDRATRERFGVTDEVVSRVLTDGVNSLIANGQAHLLGNPATREMLLRHAWMDMTMLAAQQQVSAPPAPNPDSKGARLPGEVRPGRQREDSQVQVGKQKVGMTKKEWDSLSAVTEGKWQKDIDF